MSALDELASKLAADTVAVMDKTGDNRLFYEVAKVLGSSSQTMEEAFLTEVRVRLSERAARKFLQDKVRAFKAEMTKPD